MNKDNKHICKKTSFIDEQQALFYIEKLQATSVRKKKPIRAYLCEKCFTWHLTSIQDGSNKEIETLRSKLSVKEKEIEDLKLQIDYMVDKNKKLKSQYNLHLESNSTFLNKFVRSYQKEYKANIEFKTKNNNSDIKTVILKTKFADFEATGETLKEAKLNAAILANRQFNLIGV